jgi:hypothetical protein
MLNVSMSGHGRIGSSLWFLDGDKLYFAVAVMLMDPAATTQRGV